MAHFPAFMANMSKHLWCVDCYEKKKKKKHPHGSEKNKKPNGGASVTCWQKSWRSKYLFLKCALIKKKNLNSYNSSVWLWNNKSISKVKLNKKKQTFTIFILVPFGVKVGEQTVSKAYSPIQFNGLFLVNILIFKSI